MERWCGCDNYETCNKCLRNHFGDPELERQDRALELEMDRRQAISNIRIKILKLEKKKDILESLKVGIYDK